MGAVVGCAGALCMASIRIGVGTGGRDGARRLGGSATAEAPRAPLAAWGPPGESARAQAHREWQCACEAPGAVFRRVFSRTGASAHRGRARARVASGAAFMRLGGPAGVKARPGRCEEREAQKAATPREGVQGGAGGCAATATTKLEVGGRGRVGRGCATAAVHAWCVGREKGLLAGAGVWESSSETVVLAHFFPSFLCYFFIKSNYIATERSEPEPQFYYYLGASVQRTRGGILPTIDGENAEYLYSIFE